MCSLSTHGGTEGVPVGGALDGGTESGSVGGALDGGTEGGPVGGASRTEGDVLE